MPAFREWNNANARCWDLPYGQKAFYTCQCQDEGPKSIAIDLCWGMSTETSTKNMEYACKQAGLPVSISVLSSLFGQEERLIGHAFLFSLRATGSWFCVI